MKVQLIKALGNGKAANRKPNMDYKIVIFWHQYENRLNHKLAQSQSQSQFHSLRSKLARTYSVCHLCICKRFR